MRKVSPGELDLGVRLATIDCSNVFPLPDREALREFEQLATSLIHLREQAVHPVVVFAATTSGEGSSYVSYNCARMLTLLLDRPIAWVDGNFTSPSVKVQHQEGSFKELLLNPEGALPVSPGAGLHVIGNGKRNVKNVDLINSENYGRLVRRFEENYYFTIIDAPPILGSVGVAQMAQPTMGVVLVVESRRCKYEVIRHGLEKLRGQGVSVLGTVLNKRVFELPEFVYKRL